jgi:Kef-type K+ transport system membrane component KefB
MKNIFHNDLIILLFCIGAILLLARLFAELAKKMKMPGIMGEIVLGIILGPTVFGTLDPDLFSILFPPEGPVKIALSGLTNLSVIMLLFVVGMETQLQVMLKHGKAAIYTSVVSMIIPFALGFSIVWYFPHFFNFWGEDKLPYALFFGVAMAISALPVITRILMDLNLLKTKIGMIIIAAAIFDDLVGWLLFSLVLSLIGQNSEITNIWLTVGIILGFGLFMITIGRWLINRTLEWMQKKPVWVGGAQSFALGLCFLSAAFTEYIGLHAILGAFVMGIAFGESVHMPEKERDIIHQFVTNVFAPLFFVSIGLKVNFIQHFDLPLVLLVFFLAVACKVFGGALGAYMGGLTKRESLAVGFGLNARGAMEIILGTLALNARLIDQAMFIALVVMALVTSMISGPLMKRFTDIK